LENITEIQVFDDQGTIIVTSDINQSIVGNLTNNDQVHNAINFGSPIEPRIYTNPYTGHRTLIILRTIMDNSSTDPIGAVWIEASLEEVYNQLQDISKIFVQGTLISITVTALLGILVARAITRPISAMRRQAN